MKKILFPQGNRDYILILFPAADISVRDAFKLKGEALEKFKPYYSTQKVYWNERKQNGEFCQIEITASDILELAELITKNHKAGACPAEHYFNHNEEY